MAQQQMFGSFDPELLKQSIAAEEEKNLLAQARLSPAEVQRYVAASAGRQLGGIVGGLFGVEAQDPRLRQAQLAQEAYQEALTATGGNADSPEFMAAFSNSAARRGLSSLAQQAATQASELTKAKAEAFKSQAAGVASYAQAQKEKTPAVLDQARSIVLALAGKQNLTPAEDQALTNAREILKLASPGQTISVGAKAEETEEAKQVGKGAGDQFTKVTITDLDAAEKKLGSVRELQLLSGQVDTGAFADVKAKAQSLAKDAGINLGDPTNAQTLRAAIERGVAQSQLEQKGVQTDRDAARYRTASVLLSNTPAANQYIVDYQTALAERTREKARFFERFRSDKKTSVGAEGAWQEFIRDKDIFDSPTLSKYKDTFKMNDLAKRVKGGTASSTEKQELATLMRQYGLKEVRISQ